MLACGNVILLAEDLDLGGRDLVRGRPAIGEADAIRTRRVEVNLGVGREEPLADRRAGLRVHHADEERLEVGLGQHHLGHGRAPVDGLDVLPHADPGREGDPVAVLEEGADRVRHLALGQGGAALDVHLRVDERGDLLLARLMRAVGGLGDDVRAAGHHDVVEAGVPAEFGHHHEREVRVRARVAAGPGAVRVPAAKFRIAVQPCRHPRRPVSILHDLIEPRQHRVHDGLGRDPEPALRATREDGRERRLAVRAQREAGGGDAHLEVLADRINDHAQSVLHPSPSRRCTSTTIPRHAHDEYERQDRARISTQRMDRA